MTEIESKVGDDKIMHWDYSNQCSLHHEDIGCLGQQGSQIDEFCFKATQMRAQKGIKVHGEKEKESSTKEIKNFT